MIKNNLEKIVAISVDLSLKARKELLQYVGSVMEDSYMCLLPQNEKDFSDSTNYLLKEIESIPTEEEIAKRKIELEKDIRKYFAENPYPGYGNGFEINMINFPRELGDVEVFPKDIY